METNRNVETAAEAFAAGQIARCGWEVSVQYGANQPEYDLVAVKDDLMVKVSVKGSKLGKWGLAQKYLPKQTKKKGPQSVARKPPSPDYQAAISKWLADHSRRTIFFLLQFEEVGLLEMPRMYLATPEEIAGRLRETAAGRGDCVLYEDHTWTKRAHAPGHCDRIPNLWRFSAERLTLLAQGALQALVP